MNAYVDVINDNIIAGIIGGASQTIPNGTGNNTKKLVPLWSEECKEAVKSRNRAFKLLKGSHCMNNLIDYKFAQAKVRRTARRVKSLCWREFCASIGRTTPIGKVWGMIKKMRGIRQKWSLPVLKKGNELAVDRIEKVEMFAQAFGQVHSSDNLTE